MSGFRRNWRTRRGAMLCLHANSTLRGVEINAGIEFGPGVVSSSCGCTYARPRNLVGDSSKTRDARTRDPNQVHCASFSRLKPCHAANMNDVAPLLGATCLCPDFLGLLFRRDTRAAACSLQDDRSGDVDRSRDKLLSCVGGAGLQEGG